MKCQQQHKNMSKQLPWMLFLVWERVQNPNILNLLSFRNKKKIANLTSEKLEPKDVWLHKWMKWICHYQNNFFDKTSAHWSIWFNQGRMKWAGYLGLYFSGGPPKCTIWYLVNKQNYLNATWLLLYFSLYFILSRYNSVLWQRSS